MRWWLLTAICFLMLACGEDSETQTGSTTATTTTTTTTTTTVGSGGAGGAAGGTPSECTVATDCPMATGPCAERACVAGMCEMTPLQAGTITPNQTTGDCKEERCDGMGNAVQENEDSDLPEDNIECTDDVCNNGVASHPDLATGTPCTTGVCEAGACVQCAVAADCGMDTECQTHLCTNNSCSVVNTMQGFVVSTQTAEDCKQKQCDGLGNEVEVNDDTDPPIDTNECTDNICSMGTGSNPPSMVGTACSQMGGNVCDGTGVCVECVDDAQCGGGTCVLNECAPEVIATTPADGATGIDPSTSIVLTFSEAMDPMTLTAQTSKGACTGSIQISYDNFATCLAFATASPTMSSGDTVATLGVTLAYGITYKVKVTTAATDTTALSLQGDFLMTFTTQPPPGVCAGSLVISQVYGGGGNTGATYTHDFIELHNRGTSPVVLDGWSVQYAAATGSTWQVTALSGTIPANGYYLVQEAPGAGGTTPLPTPDAIGTIAMAGANGKVALVAGIASLTGTCPTAIDFVGYGTANCAEGATAVPPLTNSTAAHRDVAGCRDGNLNNVDFFVSAANPHNSSAPMAICSCPSDIVENETGSAFEADYCNLQFPLTASAVQKTFTATIFGRIFEAGVTEAAGDSGVVVAQLGYGVENANPTAQLDWVFFPASFNVQIGNDDEYMATILAPAIGSEPVLYDYTFRFSLDGGDSWTYCDIDGAGSNMNLSFDPALVGLLTVTP